MLIEDCTIGDTLIVSVFNSSYVVTVIDFTDDEKLIVLENDLNGQRAIMSPAHSEYNMLNLNNLINDLTVL